MLSRIQNGRHSGTGDFGQILSVEVDRLDFRSALVIEGSTVLRSSIVQLLKRRGWIAHGSRIASQAFPLLKCIPYHLIVIDGNDSSVAAINFVRKLHDSVEWNRIPLVMITDSPNESLATNLLEAGVRSARRSAWTSDLTNILAELETHGRWNRQSYAN
jgi:DNA-binding NarL/FixJ family response regulator